MTTIGLVYFYFLCKWVTIAFVCKMVLDLVKLYLLHSCCSCKELKALKEEVSRVKHLAYSAYSGKEDLNKYE